MRAIFVLLLGGLVLPGSFRADESDPLEEKLRPLLRPTLEVMLDDVRENHRYSNSDFPMARGEFEKFRQDWINSLVKRTGLGDWVVRNPAGKGSPIAPHFEDRLIEVIELHGVSMEIHAVTIQPSGLVVPMVICLPGPQADDAVPGVAVFSGHTQHGLKDLIVNLESYQQGIAVRLARAGIASIAVEKIDTGYLSRKGNTGNDENEIATLLLGSTGVLRSHQIRACIAATEILAAHPRVDESKIGTTGVSLGGWLSIQTALLNDRIMAVADFGRKTRTLSPGITVENYKGQADLCHIIPGMLRLGDRNLYPAALAPLPVLAGHGIRDAGSHREHREHFREIAESQYAALGKAENYQYLIHEGGDTMPSKEVIAWFAQVFAN